MRPVCATLLAILCAPAPVMAASAVTLVLQFDQAYSTRSLDAMEREVASIVSESGITVDWRLLTDLHLPSPSEACGRPLPRSMQYGARSAFRRRTRLLRLHPYFRRRRASVQRSGVRQDQQLDPLGDVEAAMAGADSILGRALGRVLAHELFHMLARTQHHAGEGVTKSALSPAQLISDKLTMAPADLETLKKKDAR